MLDHFRFHVGVIYKTNISDNYTDSIPEGLTEIENANSTMLNYTFYGYSRSCPYWDGDMNEWSGEGCNVSVLLTELKSNF